MKKNKLAVLTSCLVLSGTFCTQAQNKTPQEIRIPDTYKLTNKSIYRNGWIDFNKNGKKIKKVNISGQNTQYQTGILFDMM